MAKLLNVRLAGRRANLPPDNEMVSFDADGVSDDLSDEIIKATADKIPGYSVYVAPAVAPDNQVSATKPSKPSKPTGGGNTPAAGPDPSKDDGTGEPPTAEGAANGNESPSGPAEETKQQTQAEN